jgi:alkylmercury lyase
MYPTLLDETVVVESPCRVTGQPVTATVTAAGVTAIHPPEAVVSLVMPTPGQPARQAFCGQVHFFASAAVAQPWLAARPEAVVVPVSTAFAVGRQLIEQRNAKGRI